MCCNSWSSDYQTKHPEQGKCNRQNNKYYRFRGLCRPEATITCANVDFGNVSQDSTSPKIIIDELSETVVVNLNNFKKVIEGFVEEKGKHRQNIVEIMYFLEDKETEVHRQITPIIKYQNPDAWIRESIIHSFTNNQGNIQT
ncbi:MAG TPA: hypothetical protein VF350_01805 [Candidatus Bathyarchaeia archaeon]